MSEITITFTGQITSLVDYQGYFGGGDLAGKPWAAVWDFTLPPGTFNQVNGSPGTTSPSFFVLFAVSPDPHHGYGLTLGNNLGTNNVSSFSVHETPTSIDAQVSNPGVSGAEIAVSTSGPPFIQLPMGLFPIDYTVNPLTDTTSTNIQLPIIYPQRPPDIGTFVTEHVSATAVSVPAPELGTGWPALILAVGLLGWWLWRKNLSRIGCASQ